MLKGGSRGSFLDIQNNDRVPGSALSALLRNSKKTNNYAYAQQISRT